MADQRRSRASKAHGDRSPTTWSIKNYPLKNWHLVFAMRPIMSLITSALRSTALTSDNEISISPNARSIGGHLHTCLNQKSVLGVSKASLIRWTRKGARSPDQPSSEIS
jgi:hypothetical protein